MIFKKKFDFFSYFGRELLIMSFDFAHLFTDEKLQELFPPDRANDFFEALYGDVEEGVYDINLAFTDFNASEKTLEFALNLTERPGKCLACHLTYGLPEVFSRHPIINISGVVDKVNELLGDNGECGEWSLGSTQTISRKMYAVPLTIHLK